MIQPAAQLPVTAIKYTNGRKAYIKTSETDSFDGDLTRNEAAALIIWKVRQLTVYLQDFIYFITLINCSNFTFIKQNRLAHLFSNSYQHLLQLSYSFFFPYINIFTLKLSKAASG